MPGNLQGCSNPRDAVGQIHLSLNSPIGKSLVYILVEGTYDCRLYSKFFNTQNASIEFVGGGKGQVINALELLKNITQKVFGICDADFRHIENDCSNISNLFFTDCHDIEMTMLHTAGVLQNVLAVYNEAKNTEVIMNKALELADFPAYTRFYNEKQSVKIDFSRVKLGDVITPHGITATLNAPEYIQKLNSRSRNKTRTITDHEIREFMAATPIEDKFNLCNGHDVTEIVALMLGGKTDHKNFCLNIQISFKYDDFKKTRLYTGILAWQSDNSYNVLL